MSPIRARQPLAQPDAICHSRTMRYLTLILSLCALPSLAFAGMTAEEFERYVTGKTLFYSQNGQEYGVERYRENRQVEWSFLDGECTQGVWYEEAGFICFAYDGWAEVQCWSFTQTPQGLLAEFARPNEDGTRNQYFAYEKDEEMICLGPDTGV